MDFDEVREYSPGDEVRTIDWNVTARAGRPFVKKFTEERELTILLLVDISASGNFGSAALSKRDLPRNSPAFWPSPPSATATRSACCSTPTASNATSRRKKAGARSARGARHSLSHARRARHRHRQALDVANHVLHRRAIVFLISDFQSPAIREHARRPAPRDASDQPPPRPHRGADPGSAREGTPNVGVLALEDAETGEVIELDTANPAVRNGSRIVLERSKRMVNDFRSEGVDTLELKTDSPYMAPCSDSSKPRAQTL